MMGAVVFSGPGMGPMGDEEPVKAAEQIEVEMAAVEAAAVPAAPAEPKRRTREEIRVEQGKA
jgi:hypothetical protein